MRALETLVEHPKNPNRHPPEQLRLLGKIIIGNGWRSPICVSTRSGFVIKGHGRLQAARLAGLSEAPVDLQDYATEADEWADMVADNKIAELAEIDAMSLAALAEDLEKQGFDLELAGLTAEPEVETELVPANLMPPPKMSWTLIGIPLVRYGEIAAHIEAIADVPDSIIEQTQNDKAD